MIFKAVGLSLRGLEFIFTLLVMALTGHIIAQAFAGNPATVNYAMFVSVFSMVSLFYLVPATWKESIAGHPMAVVVVDLLNVVFFLSAALALAAKLHVRSCRNSIYLATNEVTNGSLYHRENRCREAQASDAFLWFAWACYTASLIMSILNAWSSKDSSVKSTTRRRSPVMAQV